MKLCRLKWLVGLIAILLNFSCKKSTNTYESNSGWYELGGTNSSTLNGRITGITTDIYLNTYAAGYFIDKEGYYLAILKGNGWQKLGAFSCPSKIPIVAVTTDSVGNVYSSGQFDYHDNRMYISKWVKSQDCWYEFGNDTISSNDPILSGINNLISDSIGNFYVDSYNDYHNDFLIAKWDINIHKWIKLGGNFSFNDVIKGMTLDIYGNLYVAGYFRNSKTNYYVAKWDGSSWSELGGPNNSAVKGQIECITTDLKGNIYVAGTLRNENGNFYVAKWDGDSWSELGGKNSSTFNNYIWSITSDAKGNIYVGGTFTNENGNQYVGKWDGKSWSEVGGKNSSTFNNHISILISDKNGNLSAGGYFTNSNGKYYVAEYNP